MEDTLVSFLFYSPRLGIAWIPATGIQAKTDGVRLDDDSSETSPTLAPS
jgi:hypothetical protein